MAKVICANPEAVVKRAFFLAWQACGGSFGMGFFQDRGPGMTKDQVWDQVWEQAVGRKDYPGHAAFDRNKQGEVYGDYVFGRMMKLGLKWDSEVVEHRDGAPRGDYQSWCGKYPTYAALVTAAIDSLK